MSTQNIRLSSMLSFDEEQEKDIIQLIESLNASHKTGQFISNLIRLAVDAPELLEISDGRYKSKNVDFSYIEKLGMSYNRKKFMDSLKNDVNSLKDKVDKIYDMTMNLVILAQMNKYLGLETKTKNVMTANFILERQLKQIQDALGMHDSIFASNKIQNVENTADKALEFIIECYDGVVKELKETQTVQATQTTQATQVGQTGQTGQVGKATQILNENTQVTEDSNNLNSVSSISSIENQTQKVEEQTKQEDSNDELIDFGDADTAALLNFFGNS